MASHIAVSLHPHLARLLTELAVEALHIAIAGIGLLLLVQLRRTLLEERMPHAICLELLAVVLRDP
eukprot:7862548-Prorocentrum_lima.AAC.1